MKLRYLSVMAAALALTVVSAGAQQALTPEQQRQAEEALRDALSRESNVPTPPSPGHRHEAAPTSVHRHEAATSVPHHEAAPSPAVSGSAATTRAELRARDEQEARLRNEAKAVRQAEERRVAEERRRADEQRKIDARRAAVERAAAESKARAESRARAETLFSSRPQTPTANAQSPAPAAVASPDDAAARQALRDALEKAEHGPGPSQ